MTCGTRQFRVEYIYSYFIVFPYLNWDFVLYLKGEEPNVSQARNLQVTGIQDEPATAAEDVNRFAAIEASQQCQELYSTHLILLRHQETPHLGV